jgi:hypothetical protein
MPISTKAGLLSTRNYGRREQRERPCIRDIFLSALHPWELVCRNEVKARLPQHELWWSLSRRRTVLPKARTAALPARYLTAYADYWFVAVFDWPSGYHALVRGSLRRSFSAQTITDREKPRLKPPLDKFGIFRHLIRREY